MSTRIWKKAAYTVSAISLFLCVSQPAHAAWPFGGTTALNNFGAPVIGDLDGDGKREILAMSLTGGKLYCLDAKGNQLWQYNAPYSSTNPPTLANVDSNPTTLEVIIGGNVQITPQGTIISQGEITILSASGNLLLNKKMVPSSPNLSYISVDQIAWVADANADGMREIYFTTNGSYAGDNILYSMNPNGAYRFQALLGIQESKIVNVLDINGDGQMEIITLSPQIFSSGPLPTFKAWSNTGQLLWSLPVNDSVTGVTGVDLNKDGTMELVYGTQGHKLKALRAATGTLLWEQTLPWQVKNGPAVSDLTGDGKPELVIAVDYPLNAVYALDGNGNIVWNTVLNIPQYGVLGWGGLSVGDVDENGEPDILVGTNTSGGNPAASMVKLNKAGAIVAYTLLPADAGYYSPALADMDGHGNLEICYGSYSSPGVGAALNCLNADLTQFQPTTIRAQRGNMVWPMVRHDLRQSSRTLE